MISRRGFIQGIAAMTIPVSTGARGFRNRLLPIFQAGNRIVINSAGLFVYNGPPTFGNLIINLSFAGGSDKYGNTYLAGINQYGPANPSTSHVQIYNGDISFYGAHTNAIPGFIGEANGPTDCALIMQSGQDNAQNAEYLTLNGSGATPKAIFSQPGITISNALGNRQLEVQSNSALFGTARAGISLTDTDGKVAEAYVDTFGQLHTPEAFQTDINVEASNQIAPPGAGGSGSKYYSTSGHMQSRSGQTGIGGDTNSYDTEAVRVFLGNDGPSQSNVANAVVSDGTTSLQHHVGIGTYKITALIGINAEVAAGIINVGMFGPGVSTGGFSGEVLDNAPTTNENWSTGALPTQSYTQTNIGRTTKIRFEGIITFTAAGNVNIQTRTSNVADTYHVRAGSYIEFCPVVAV